MSRIIVKNLPDVVDPENLKKKFGELGTVTDVQLKYTKSGKFRKFGFIGYDSPVEAEKAIEHFNRTFFGTSQIQVELCAELGDAKKPKAWSKYAPDSSTFKKLHGSPNEKPEKEKKTKKSQTKSGIRDEELLEKLKQHKDDPDFLEFMELHGKADKVRALGDDEDQDSGVEDDDESKKEDNEKLAHSEGVSDMDYLKAKMKSQNSNNSKDESCQEKKTKKEKEFFTVKIMNLPYKAKKKDIKSLFHPIPVASISMPSAKGFAFARFKEQKQMRQALVKNKTFLNGKQLIIQEQKKTEKQDPKTNRWKDQEEALKNEESIAESGRIFIRNLAYTVTEDEIESAFAKYGPLAELVFPIDKESRQGKGYCIVTYLMPEHAVAAYSAMDGTVLHGRMLHLLPGKAKESNDDDEENSNFKNKKDKNLKAKAGSSHNWNTLFLDMNAVAETVSEKFGLTKEQVLTGNNAAVTMALAETQLVTETKRFLESNGVQLDAFNHPAAKRSKTTILVKNLPAKTTVPEIRDLFVKFGELGRIILPPSGVTAIVDFCEPSEARAAFKRLAYSKFKSKPLYLEWAPEASFNLAGVKPIKDEEEVKEEEKDGDEEKEKQEQEDDGIIPESDATLFVKNLNFDTTEEDVKKHFKKCGKIAMVTIARKKDPQKPGTMLSMGYGFVHFYLKSSLNQALKTLQGSTLMDHMLELKRSNRTLPQEVMNTRKLTDVENQTSNKIIVRNIPFEATQKEINDLFKTFGELKFVRLPKKMAGTGPHRGFAFVEFVTKHDAKRAMDTLCQSTHLLGRRLVLEWAKPDDDVADIRKRTAKDFQDYKPSDKKKAKIVVDEKKKGDDDEEDDDDDEMAMAEIMAEEKPRKVR